MSRRQHGAGSVFWDGKRKRWVGQYSNGYTAAGKRAYRTRTFLTEQSAEKWLESEGHSPSKLQPVPPAPPESSRSARSESAVSHDGTPSRKPGEPDEPVKPGNPEGAFERALDHFGDYISTTRDADIFVLALWALHTYMLDVVPVSPRLIIDSILPGSGKTTVLEHYERTCMSSLNMSDITSSALLVRTLSKGRRTFLIDEADRSLDPERESTKAIMSVINSGYKPGTTRPVLVPSKEDGWVSEEMPTYCAVAMAGNSPLLPDDTVSRAHRVFLVPALEGQVTDTDWTEDGADDQALAVGRDLAAWAALHSDEVKAARPDYPKGTRGRLKERWVSFARIAQVLGGEWSTWVQRLIAEDIDRERKERESGMQHIPPRMQVLLDVAEIIDGRGFIPTEELLAELRSRRPDVWGSQSVKGALTMQALGRMLSKARILADREKGGDRRRGYFEADVTEVTAKLSPTGSDASSGSAGHLKGVAS